MKKQKWGKQRAEELFRRACLDYRGAVTVYGNYHPHLVMFDSVSGIVISLDLNSFCESTCGFLQADHVDDDGTWRCIDISFIFDDEDGETELLDSFFSKHLVKDEESGGLC